MADTINITGINYFLPLFSFFFVFLVIYAILFKTKILGDNNKWVNLILSFIMSIIFVSFASTELYIRTIVPWFAVLLVCVFLVLLLGAFSANKLEVFTKPAFGWVVVGILIVIFLIAAIRVFNPVFHPEYVLTSGDSPMIIGQIRNLMDSKVAGGLLLLVITIAVSWIITKK